MGPPTTSRSKPTLERYAWLLGIAWTLVLTGLFSWNLSQSHRATEELATDAARAHFNKDRALRLWATSHTLIYAPASERNPPDPHLEHLPERDVLTPSGVKLTVVNPARMIRQMDEKYGHHYPVKSRITSLQPLRPQNAPDPWELEVLEPFNQGRKDAFEIINLPDRPTLRLMRPLKVLPECLNCHLYQGLQPGEVTGAVGVSLPIGELLLRESEQILHDAITYALVWLALLIGSRKLARYEDNRKAAILQSALDCIVSMDAQGRITEFNPAAERTFGHSRQQAVGRMLADILIPPDLRKNHKVRPTAPVAVRPGSNPEPPRQDPRPSLRRQ